LPEGAGPSRPVLFTYDVVWVEYASARDPWKTRWNVFLRMDDGIPQTVQLFGLVVAVIINVMLGASLYFWMMRDLSYRPLLSIGEEEEGGGFGDDPVGRGGAAERGDDGSSAGDGGGGDREPARSELERDARLWPLSTRLFFPPRVAPLWLCLCSGMGAQLLLAAFVFVLLFRTGIVNESMGSQILTPAVVLYTLASALGGYVTARWWGLFHGDRLRAFQACGVLAVGFPLLGLLVLYLTYDVLVPEASPEYRVVSNSLPLVLVWLLGVVPLTFAGGWWGYVKGPMPNFPVSEGTKGYQDLNVHGGGDHDTEERKACCCWRHARIIVVFLAGGVPPVACSFVEFAYGVAGPIYVGYYSDASFYAILSFFLFCACVGLVACLLFYQQIRARNFEWWWTSFVVGVSAGFYLFLLSMSWILYDYVSEEALVSGETLASYTIWFAFGSLGASLIAGFVSLGSCILMTRLLYAFLMRRSTASDPSGVTNEPAQEEGEEIVASSRRYNMSSITESER
jgi:transmembrane 9 superfamily protein 2/4